jgi:hypothetical protein
LASMMRWVSSSMTRHTAPSRSNTWRRIASDSSRPAPATARARRLRSRSSQMTNAVTDT